MMLKIGKDKVKIGGAALLALLFCGCYIGLTYYSIPEKANATTWFPETIKSISTMQEMTPEICNNTKTTDGEVMLIDTRDDSTYTVKKVGERCWMTQNLRIINKTIYGPDVSGHEQDSNLASGAQYTIPVSSSPWSDTDNTIQKVHYANNATYGAYYTWCTATANNCSSVAFNGAEVSYDICPKGWQLPSGKPGTGTNDFAVVAGLTSANITVKNNFWSSLSGQFLDGNILTVNGIPWVAAGAVYRSNLGNIDRFGYYWSRTSYSSSTAYNLDFYSGDFYPAYTNERYYGYSVRCIAKTDSESEEPSSALSTSGDINVKIDSTLTLDAVTGPDTINAVYTKVATGEIIAMVSTNALSYNVLLSAAQPNLTSKSGEIVPASSNVVAGTSAWGILNSATEESYVPITTTPSTYYNNKVFNNSTQDYTHTFTLGISAAPSLPADIYTTDVTVTVATT